MKRRLIDAVYLHCQQRSACQSDINNYCSPIISGCLAVTTRHPLSRACHVSHPTSSQSQLLESCLINIIVWVSKLGALIVGICCQNAIVMSLCNYSIKIYLNRINRDHETQQCLAFLAGYLIISPGVSWQADLSPVSWVTRPRAALAF